MKFVFRSNKDSIFREEYNSRDESKSNILLEIKTSNFCAGSGIGIITVWPNYLKHVEILTSSDDNVGVDKKDLAVAEDILQ